MDRYNSWIYAEDTSCYIIRGYMQRKHHVTTPSKYMDRYNSWIYAEETSCYDTIKGYG